MLFLCPRVTGTKPGLNQSSELWIGNICITLLCIAVQNKSLFLKKKKTQNMITCPQFE